MPAKGTQTIISGARKGSVLPRLRAAFDADHVPTGTQRMKATCAYDGTEFQGWMLQPGARTVQGTIEERLHNFFKRPVAIAGSGRTDAGVSARAQVFHLDIDPQCTPGKLLVVLQSGLPPALRVTGVEAVPDSFHARHSCLGKRYCYTILTRQASPFEARWCWSLAERMPCGQFRPFDLDAVRSAARSLLGVHDFSQFCVIGKDDPRSPVRHLRRMDVDDHGDGRVVITGESDRFLYKQMRMMVGTLAQVGLGAVQAERVAALLAPGELSPHDPGWRRHPAVYTAPPCGLVLDHVFYGAEGEYGTRSTDPAGDHDE